MAGQIAASIANAQAYEEEKKRAEALAEIGRALRSVPVIMLSARAGEEARVEGLEASADDYLIKPFSARELIARVSSALELSRVRQDAAQSRQALHESEEKFRHLADNMSQFAWMADDKGGILWYNRRWFNYTGATFEEMQGWGWNKVHHPDHLDRVIAGMQKKSPSTCSSATSVCPTARAMTSCASCARGAG